jgi:hypothetical protein
MITKEYSDLLEALKGDDIKTLSNQAKAFEMHKRFPRFSVAYPSLVMTACHRESPMPTEMLKKLLCIASMQKAGIVEEGKARGMAMDATEAFRRSARETVVKKEQAQAE